MSMEEIIGDPEPGKFAADLVRRVLDIAFDQGHPDQRHSEHWWDREDWPLDGRQWSYNGQINRYEFNQRCVTEHELRKEKKRGSGSDEITIQRKLEGKIWGEKKFPLGRTTIRSKKIFPANKFQQDDDDAINGTLPWWNLFTEATNLDSRSLYDTSIGTPTKIMKIPFDDYVETFENEDVYPSYGSNVTQHKCKLLDVSWYSCTDDFATKGDQELNEDNIGIPSLSVRAMVYYSEPINIDDDSNGDGDHDHVTMKVLGVIAEAPVASFNCIEQLNERISGFVFTCHDDVDDNTDDPNGKPKTANSNVQATYVESSSNDLETLEDDEKDALLDDRALVVHRLVQKVTGNQINVAASPSKLPFFKPKPVGMPPLRTLRTMMQVHLPDPRWPLKCPNSVCLECGKDPKAAADDGKLMHCTRCCVRKFCSSGCMTKSWKSDIWSHRIECKAAQKQNKYNVNGTRREKCKKLVDGGICTNEQANAMIDAIGKTMGEESLDVKYDSVPQMQEKHRKDARDTRKARKNAKKKKGKGKKK
mmetsp:Transcript_19813/g.22329  ORF Transcript_19813/g.22329 Transcript_19813/m.22329 type:complete len:532 (-) Transcript_19813:163-1758(-)